MQDHEAQLAEVDKVLLGSLDSHPLDPLTLAEYVVQRRELYELVHPTAIRHGGNRYTRKARPSSFLQDTAALLNCSVQSVWRSVMRATLIDADLRDALHRHCPTVCQSGAELDRLAELPAEQQRQVVADITDGKFKSVREAIG